LNEFVKDVKANQIHILPIELGHILKVEELPFFHSDPFDRLIIAQSIVEDLVIISSDEKFKEYEIKLIWK
jgi:PIN domain nuclease of toxin-antitoxin system